MKDVRHPAIAEKKDKCFGLVSKGQIDAQLCDSIQDNLPKIRVHTDVSVQNTGNRRNTDTCGGCNLMKPNLAYFRVVLAHALNVPVPNFRGHDLDAFPAASRMAQKPKALS